MKSGLIEGSNIAEMLKNPESYIESRDYFSWERFFTARLVQATADSYLKYGKRQLNPAYLHERAVEKILSVMKGIDLK